MALSGCGELSPPALSCPSHFLFYGDGLVYGNPSTEKNIALHQHRAGYRAIRVSELMHVDAAILVLHDAIVVHQAQVVAIDADDVSGHRHAREGEIIA